MSIVTWASEARLTSHAVSGPDDPAVLDAFHGLSTGGGSDLAAGLASAYSLAEAQATTDSVNRVVLISDGGATLGTA